MNKHTTHRMALTLAMSQTDREGQVFMKACELAGIPATRRQMSKWRRRTGAAWRHVRAAEAELMRKERSDAEA